MVSYRSRQAPSPTGYLHLGTARTLLFTILISLNTKGSWYLRIEDTDQNRLQKEAVYNLVEVLNLLQIDIPEGVTLEKTNIYNSIYSVFQKGNFGPYIQSERLNLYHKYAQILIDKKLAYWNFITQDEKQELIEIKNINHQPIDYFKINSDKITEKELYMNVENGLSNPNNPALFCKIKSKRTIKCNDLLLGSTEFDLSLEEDFAILKSDGFPTYHLAHPVDDFLMNTNLIIRSQEWYPSLPKHVLLFNYLWFDEDQKYISSNGKNVPEYIHLPFILPEIGNKKLSKRDGVVNTLNYIQKGYLPEALINYLVFLGWNPKTDQELYLNEKDF